MKEQSKKEYLDAPDTKKKTTKEQLIYSGDVLSEIEVKRESDEKRLITE